MKANGVCLNGLPADGSADITDADSDAHNSWQEWRCGTCPTDAEMTSPQFYRVGERFIKSKKGETK